MGHLACPGPQMVGCYPLHYAPRTNLLFAVHPMLECHPLILRQSVSGLQAPPVCGNGGRIMAEGGRLLNYGVYGGP